MAFLAVLDGSPYTVWLIWGGWLFICLYALFFTIFNRRSVDDPGGKRDTLKFSRFILRLGMLMSVPLSGALISLQDFFYSAVAGNALSIVIALFFAFILKAFSNLEGAKKFGIGLLIFVLILLGITIYPFVAEIIRFYQGASNYQIFYIGLAFLIEFMVVLRMVFNFIRSGSSVIGSEIKNPFVYIGLIFGWMCLLSIPYIYLQLT